MANETEVIRDKMEETRNNLSDKLEQLENKVVDSVQSATSAVAETVQNATVTVNEAVQSAKDVVESVKDSFQGTVDSVKGTVDSVKDSVEGTVESVRETFQSAADSVKDTFHSAAEGFKDTFDLPKQMDRHPWLMLGGAVAVGFVAGKLLDRAPQVGRAAYGLAERAASTMATTASAVGSAASAAGSAASAAGSMLGTLENMFGPEINKVKELALGALIGVIRDMAVKAAPETLAPQVRDVIDGFTSKLGGKPVEGTVLGEQSTDEPAYERPGRRF